MKFLSYLRLRLVRKLIRTNKVLVQNNFCEAQITMESNAKKYKTLLKFKRTEKLNKLM